MIAAHDRYPSGREKERDPPPVMIVCESAEFQLYAGKLNQWPSLSPTLDLPEITPILPSATRTLWLFWLRFGSLQSPVPCANFILLFFAAPHHHHQWGSACIYLVDGVVLILALYWGRQQQGKYCACSRGGRLLEILELREKYQWDRGLSLDGQLMELAARPGTCS